MRCKICGWDNPNGISQCKKCGNTINSIKECRDYYRFKDNAPRYSDNSIKEDSENKKSAKILLIFAGIFAILGGYLGSLIGFMVYYAKDVVIDPESRRIVKLKKYKESHRKTGLIIGFLGIVCWIIWLIIFYSTN